MTQKENNCPDLLIAQRPLRSRHARGENSIIDNPLQLAIRVSLNLSRSQRRYRRRHVIHKWHPGILAIHSVAADTIVRKCLFPFSDHLRGLGKRILLSLISDQDAMLRKGREVPLHTSGRICLTGSHPEQDPDRQQSHHHPHGYSTTCSVTVI